MGIFYLLGIFIRKQLNSDSIPSILGLSDGSLKLPYETQQDLMLCVLIAWRAILRERNSNSSPSLKKRCDDMCTGIIWRRLRRPHLTHNVHLLKCGVFFFSLYQKSNGLSCDEVVSVDLCTLFEIPPGMYIIIHPWTPTIKGQFHACVDQGYYQKLNLKLKQK